MGRALSFRLGTEREHVMVEIDVTEAIADNDPYGWVSAKISVAAGAFRGAYTASLRANDFAPFHRELSLLQERLSGTAKFETLENQLRIQVEGDGKGHMLAHCEAMDLAGTGNKLAFRLEFDQTELVPTLRDLNEICAAIASLVKGRG